jgi:hypothetical protein
MTLRRSIFAAALAALVSLPNAALAQRASTRSSTSGASALSIGGGVGFEFGDLDGFGLRADAVLPLQQLTPQVSLGLVGTFGFTHFGEDFGPFDLDWNVFKVVPAARFGFNVTPQLSVYGDAGLGLYFANASIDSDDPFFDTSESDSEVGVVMRFAAGGLFAVTPKLQVGAELGLNPYFGDVDDNTVSLFGVLLYKL